MTLNEAYILGTVVIALAYHVAADLVHKNKTKRIEKFLSKKFKDYMNGEK